MEENKAISLYELNLLVKSGIKQLFPGNYWIIAEISELNINQSGHCYLELIEKSSESEQITAKAKATIWAFTFRMLKPYFESVTGQRFSTGIKVMLSVSIEFHELFGFSLNVKDIEPNFTIGDLARKKQQIIKQLQEEGVYHLNKELEFPIVPQSIAIISSDTAAGYGDFMDHLKQNRYGYKFHTKLFKAYMQGSETEKSIIHALEKIFDSKITFDMVVIIRGGGSQSDLNYFNSYWLAYHITQFPIPVVTGIGHERDETITDMVAHTSLKTPTAVAEFIIEKTAEFDNYISDLHESIIEIVTNKLHDLNENLYDIRNNFVSIVGLIMSNNKQQLDRNETIFRLNIKNKLSQSKQKLQYTSLKIPALVNHVLQLQKKDFEQIEKNRTLYIKQISQVEKKRLSDYKNRAHLLDPIQLLKKGYTLTFNHGVLIKSIDNLKLGDTLTSKWIDGSVQSVVENININKLKTEET